MILKLKRTPGIYLTGFMGCGKSTVGAALAEELGWTFLDLDAQIEREQGTSIALIFAEQGEAAFRAMESAALAKVVRQIAMGQPRVIALGGGTFQAEPNRRLMNDNGVTIWLDCPFETVEQRVGEDVERPLARDPEKFRALFEARRQIYAMAEYHIDSQAGDARAVMAKILELGLV